MDAFLSVYGDGRTGHGDGLAALAPASGVALVAAGAPGGGGWRTMVGQRAARTGGRADWRSSGGHGGRRSTGADSGARVSCGRARGGRRSRTRVGRRARGRRRAGRRAMAEQQRPGELRLRSRREARQAAGGGRWSSSALRVWAGEWTGAAPAGVVGGAAPGRAAAAG